MDTTERKDSFVFSEKLSQFFRGFNVQALNVFRLVPQGARAVLRGLEAGVEDNDAATVKQVNDAIVAGKPASLVVVEADFTGNNYSHASLVGKAADTGFAVFADTGGGILKNGADYTFVSGTGTITMPDGPADIRIVF